MLPRIIYSQQDYTEIQKAIAEVLSLKDSPRILEPINKSTLVAI